MRVLQINKFLYPKGGSESYMFSLGEALKQLGHEVKYWGMEDKKNIVCDFDSHLPKNVDIGNRSILKKIDYPFKLIYSFDAKRKLEDVIKKWKPEIAHIHNFNFQLTTSIIDILKNNAIPIIYTAHDSQLVCPYHRMYKPKTNQVCDKCLKGGFYNCIKDKCFDGSIIKSSIGAFESYFNHSRKVYDKIDVIISPSSFLASQLNTRLKHKIEVIHNFINAQYDTKSSKKEYILYFGRISSEKGIFKMVSHFEERKVPLKIIGDGPDLEFIRNGKYVECLGRKQGTELFKYIQEAKFVIQPSIWFENCPMTVIESFSQGTPVIASDHSGFKELIKHGETGFLYDFSKDEDIAQMFTMLNEFKSNESMSQNCINEFSNRFSEDSHVKRVVELYKTILNNSN